MTRQEILNDYDIRQGIIHTPGKFEAEPIYTPYFYDIMMNGGGDETEYDDDGTVIDSFNITEEDIKVFPELKNTKQIRLWTSDQGFVYHETTEEKTTMPT